MEKTWHALNWYAINPGRNYELFSELSGVRGGYGTRPIATPGWPEDASWGAKLSNQINISDSAESGYNHIGRSVSVTDARILVENGTCQYIKDKIGNNIALTHPDWHSHGHCTVRQMSNALRGNSLPEYRAMLAAARSLERDGMEVRFIFYYDN
jgi:hypothetical protein